MPQLPVIVVPGITATGLSDYYPMPPEKVWTAVLRKGYERFALHPDNVRYEAQEPARLQPTDAFAIVYEDLVEALRHDLRPDSARPTPVFPFGYDWRQDCTHSADQLNEFVKEVIERTNLLPHYRPAAGQVDLVGHSMGGLIIADYLARYGGQGRVRKVVTIGTPFQGAVDAVNKLTTGMGQFGGGIPRDREREAARTVPAVYQLLPTFRGAAVLESGQSRSLFNADLWQPSIIKTLGEYIKQHKARIDPATLFSQYLSTAKRFRGRVDRLKVGDVLPGGEDDWLPIAGVGAKTLVRVTLRRKDRNAPVRFEFPELENDWPAGANTGDGTVPLAGARPKFMDAARLVCVSPRDFSAWEFQDRALARLAGFHGALPTVNLVQRITLRFLRRDYKGSVWARRPPGLAGDQWQKPAWLPEAD